MASGRRLLTRVQVWIDDRAMTFMSVEMHARLVASPVRMDDKE